MNKMIQNFKRSSAQLWCKHAEPKTNPEEIKMEVQIFTGSTKGNFRHLHFSPIS